MKIISLDDIDAPITNVACDVCIIGAGAGGLFLTNKLSQMGMDLVLLEAGSRICVPGDEIGIEAECPVSDYGGVSAGRAFGLGGSTSAWGGVLIPFPTQDHRSTSDISFGAWKNILEIVSQRSSAVAEKLGASVDYFVPARSTDYPNESVAKLRDIGLTTGVATWLPFRRRNFSYLISEIERYGGDTRVYLNAVACNWKVKSAGLTKTHISQVEARNISGRRLLVEARMFVLSAGAIESARIIQEIDAANAANVIRPGAAVGRYLSDHLSSRIAKIDSSSTIDAIKIFGPRFAAGCMRTFRFIESVPSQSYPRYFAHLLFDNDSAGFKLARSMLQGVQARRWPSVSSRELWSGSVGALSLMYSRLFHKRLFVPESSAVYLQMDMEQEAEFENCVTLGQETDIFGRRKAIVNWDVSGNDCQNIETAASAFLARWRRGEGSLLRLTAVSESASGLKPHDVYHPVGTCRMGEHREAVVDSDLLVHGTDNLFVLSTAVFPTAGSANPTFSMLCLADSLGDHLQDGRPAVHTIL